MKEMLQHQLLGNSLQDWLLASLGFVLTFTLMPLLRGVIGRQAARYHSEHQPAAVALLLHLLRHTSGLFLLTVALYVAERLLTFRGQWDRIADVLVVVGFWLQVGLWLMAAVRFGLQRRGAGRGDGQFAGTLSIVTFVAGLVVWTVVVLLALDNLGVNITALVAGLGVGGIAIALAVQTILGDLFASLSIALDKPFGVGDLLRVDDCEGTVEQIGIKSTRLRSVTGEQIIMANADLLKSRVRNMQRMTERRALLRVRIEHGTPAAQLARVPIAAAAAVASVPQARFEYCLLRAIAEWSLDYDLLFYLPYRGGNEYALALDGVQRELLERLEAAGIPLASAPGSQRVKPG